MSETPPPCDKDIYKNGTLVLMTHTIRSAEMETWVKKIAKYSGQPVDWHFAGGRACVLALGNLAKVRATILKFKHLHDKLQKQEVDTIHRAAGYERDFTPSWTLYGENDSNPAHEFARQIVLERD